VFRVRVELWAKWVECMIEAGWGGVGGGVVLGWCGAVVGWVAVGR